LALDCGASFGNRGISFWQQLVRDEMLDIYFVVVLYGCRIEESSACRSLLSMTVPEGVQLYGLVYDNTPAIAAEGKRLSNNVEYLSTGNNGGLPVAYNEAIRRAQARRARYLMLVDQDSTITIEFLKAVIAAVKNASVDQVAWVPLVVAQGRLISPFKFNRLGLPTFKCDFSTPPHGCFAINSYSIISLSFLEAIGGFDEFYWLDGLDFWLYSRVARMGYRIGIIEERVTHRLSLLGGGISASRLSNIAHYEVCFFWEYFSKPQAIVGSLRVLARGVRHTQTLSRSGKILSYLREMAAGMSAGLSRR
jgi:GT2 family glycosyltransferase